MTTYALNSAQKIIGNIKWDLADSLKRFSLVSLKSGFFIAGVSVTEKQLCLYQLNESLIKPNPITKISCNSTTANITYNDVSFDPLNSLIAVGNHVSAYIFKVNVTDKAPLSYLCNAFMPKAEEVGYKNVFSPNGTLVAVNDLWVASINIDLSVPLAKVISAERTEKYLKVGGTTAVSINKEFGSKEKTFTVVTNANKKM